MAETASAAEVGPNTDSTTAASDMAVDSGPARPPRPRVPCPGCGKLLALRTLAEKHVCVRKVREPRKGWTMEPGKRFERQKAAAIRRFEQRNGCGVESQELPILDGASQGQSGE